MLGIGIDIGCRAVYNHHHSINEAASYALPHVRSTRVAMWKLAGIGYRVVAR